MTPLRIDHGPPIRDALGHLYFELANAAAGAAPLDAPVILLPLTVWIRLQNAITVENNGPPEERHLQPTPAREFRYGGFVFRIDRGGPSGREIARELGDVFHAGVKARDAKP